MISCASLFVFVRQQVAEMKGNMEKTRQELEESLKKIASNENGNLLYRQ